jgi:hypothetical protein
LLTSKAQKPATKEIQDKKLTAEIAETAESRRVYLACADEKICEKSTILRHWQCRGRADGAEERTKNTLWAKLRGKKLARRSKKS